MHSWSAGHRRCFWLSCLVTIALTCGWAPAARAVSVRDVPDPRPDSWVVDQTETLSPETQAEIDDVARRVHEEGGELVVVVVNDLSGAPPRRFATELGNRWHLNPRGVLILVAKRSRAAEIILGKAVDGQSQVRASQRVMDHIMVPSFRAGKYGEGLLAGARAVERRILASEVVPEPSDPPAQALLAEAPVGPPSSAPEAGSASDPEAAEAHPASIGSLVGLGLACLLAAGALVKGVVWALRPPRCSQCGVPRVKLGEVEDDAHLSKPERLEETLGSVDYALWACPGCGDILKRRRRRLFTSLRRCPACGFVTVSRVSSVLEGATYESKGLAEVVEDCNNCDHHLVTRHTIPRKTDDSTSSFSSGGSGSSSSSSSGGSFSSGAGASGRW